MWFIGVEVEQETSAPPPKKKMLDPPLYTYFPVVLFIMLYQRWFVLTERAFESVDKILW